MNKVLSIALMVLVFASCQNTSESVSSEVATSDSNTMPIAPAIVPDYNSLKAVANSPAAPSSITVPAAPVTAPVTAPATAPATVNKNAAGLNPAHGTPGHRCDIAVGAPLNSPPGNTPTPVAAPIGNAGPAMMQNPAKTPAPTQPSGKAGRLNPAHGEPGHDCSVAVGAPLKG
jgi:hypothetical protein